MRTRSAERGRNDSSDGRHGRASAAVALEEPAAAAAEPTAGAEAAATAGTTAVAASGAAAATAAEPSGATAATTAEWQTLAAAPPAAAAAVAAAVVEDAPGTEAGEAQLGELRPLQRRLGAAGRRARRRLVRGVVGSHARGAERGFAAQHVETDVDN